MSDHHISDEEAKRRLTCISVFFGFVVGGMTYAAFTTDAQQDAPPENNHAPKTIHLSENDNAITEFTPQPPSLKL